ncbi:hypothetical protein IE077_001657 [Cardiosporidium cionae]|uniref:Secreted protein n=1 Tax=Cardiosporidium cionae TaxID=476202 RepID=A0ABQ7J3V6_9APIC|nr:hypothetical protein IE077_001657 [Cardiosporidium cionae]|eukprot:KAF8817773.1 hypothetical protein IE077_001657 [Cardiosporidium cionae]
METVTLVVASFFAVVTCNWVSPSSYWFHVLPFNHSHNYISILIMRCSLMDPIVSQTSNALLIASGSVMGLPLCQRSLSLIGRVSPSRPSASSAHHSSAYPVRYCWTSSSPKLKLPLKVGRTIRRATSYLWRLESYCGCGESL